MTPRKLNGALVMALMLPFLGGLEADVAHHLASKPTSFNKLVFGTNATVFFPFQVHE